MTNIRMRLAVAASIALAGCATANIQPSDLNALGSAPTVEEVSKIAHGSPLYRLDYLAGGHTFIYETYEATDTGRYYGMLFQDAKLIAVDVTGRGGAYWPGLRACTLFPPKADLDVDGCFQKFNRTVEAAAVEVAAGVTPDQAAKDRSANDKAGAIAEGTVETVLFAPILIPVAVVTLPVMGAAAAGDNSRRAALDVKLGDSYDDIRSRVEQYPDKYRSIMDGKGTVLIPGAVVPNAAAALGVDGGKVIWIDLIPNTECGGGFMFWGMTCKMGEQSRPPAQHLRAKTAPVMDHWENIALYYSPPANYEVMGRVSGKAQGFSAHSRMGNAIEDMKEWAQKMGATGVLVGLKAIAPGEEPIAAPPPGTGSPVYAADSTVPIYGMRANGWAIYVPTDADAFQKAAQIHGATCDALSQKKDDTKDAYEAVEKTGTPAEITTAQQALQSVKDTADAAYCGDDDWYAEQMAAMKH
jgi:hypothetical protein